MIQFTRPARFGYACWISWNARLSAARSGMRAVTACELPFPSDERSVPLSCARSVTGSAPVMDLVPDTDTDLGFEELVEPFANGFDRVSEPFDNGFGTVPEGFA